MTKTKKYSFRFVLSTLFTVLVLAVGGVIGILNYTQIKEILLSASDETYNNFSDKLVINYSKTKQSVFNTLKLLSHTSLSDSTTLDERLANIMVLSAAIHTEKSITAIQLGYENGDFFNVIKINTDTLKEHFKAPDNVFLLVDNIQASSKGGSRLTRLYLDNDLNIIKRNKPYNTRYDPRTRPWFKQAKIEPEFTDPYYFYFIHKTGITTTMKMHRSNTVIAMDVTLENISSGLDRLKMPARSELYMVTSDGAVVASSNSSEKLMLNESETKNSLDKLSLKNVAELESDVLSAALKGGVFSEKSLRLEVNDALWKGAVKRIGRLGGADLYLLMFTPVKELLKDAVSIGWTNLYVLLVIIILVLPLVWFISRRISVAMQYLAFDAKQIMSFDFSESPALHSKITEVDELDNAQSMMKSSLSQFISLINSLAVEKNFDSLLEKITTETFNASKADIVATYLLNENDRLLQVKSLEYKDEYEVDNESLPVFSMDDESEVYELIKSADCKHLFQNSESDKHWLILAEKMNSENLQLIILPLRNRQSEFMGMVILGYVKNDSLSVNKQQQSLAFVQAFSEFAAVSLESKQLLKMQEDLLDAFIKLIAGAIDAKSPYTGGHCQRVPEITKMLAQAACDSTEPLFNDYQLDEDHWQELHIASWLHDCGKVTTPEYVVDKSTKLETIYDRIHEIRMRFEVLKRDAEIDYWKALSEGGDKASLGQELEKNLKELDDDFEFVATCNQGGEFMEDEKIEKLNKISSRCWIRTLNSSCGVSWEEKQRMGVVNNQKLPVEERLLADKPEHIIPRNASDIITDDNPWGFKLDVPENKFNKGELYNLAIKRGTLSSEERFIINDHMVQTIKMLEELPYPSYLKNVPVIAGCHHETMDGKGYPKRLTKDDMPLTARMMAIADIFEALTASDRPYKKAKSLNESLRIMSFMRNDLHIDSDLFDLFLHSGIYLKYAELYLNKEQIDNVDINQYLSS